MYSNQKNKIRIIAYIYVILNVVVASQISFFKNDSIYSMLSISSDTLGNNHYWQLFSNFFLLPKSPLSLNFVINLFFQIYIIWTFGISLLERLKTLLFFTLFFLSGILSSLLVAIILYFYYPTLYFSSILLTTYSVLCSFAFFNKDAQIKLFFVIPFKAQKLILSALGIYLFFALTDLNILLFAGTAMAAFIGYLFSMFVLKVENTPFMFSSVKFKFFSFLKFFSFRKKSSKENLYDFKTGNHIKKDKK